MLTTVTAAAGIMSLALTVWGAWKHSPACSWLGGLAFVGFIACMLLLDRPWTQILLPALTLLGITGWFSGREAP